MATLGVLSTCLLVWLTSPVRKTAPCCCLSAAAGVLLLCFGAQAASADTPVEEEHEALEDLATFLKEETVSIAVRHDQPISEAPSNVYVITDEDIRHSGAPDLPTILRRIPGVEVMQTNGAEFNVSIRGNNQLVANKLLVLVDGRTIYVDAQTAVVWKLLPVTLPEIKRIEVLKGPASALYGFNAFDGIINIITKSPGEMDGVLVHGGAGGHSTATASAIRAGKVGRLGYRLSLGYDQNEQWDETELAFRSYKFNALLEHPLPRQSRLVIAGGLVNADRFESQVQPGNRTLSMEPGQGYAKVAIERRNFFLRGFWNRFDDTSEITQEPPLTDIITITDLSSDPTSDTRSDTFDVESQQAWEFTLQGEHRLTYGLNYRHVTLSNNFIDKFSRENRLGLYLQEEWKIARPLTVTAGLRFDLHSEINPTYSPRGAFVYKPAQNHTLRGAISIAYRPPTLFESNLASQAQVTLPPQLPPGLLPPGACAPPSPPFPVCFPISPGFTLPVEGSENLKPEKIISYDLGYQGWFFRHRLRLRADLFYNQIGDLVRVSRRQTNPADIRTVTFFPVNGPTGHVYGGEVGIEVLVTPELSGFANYAYQDHDDSFRRPTKPIVSRSKVNAGLRVELENGLNGEMAFHYVGSYTYPLGGFFNDLGLLLPGTTPIDPHVDNYYLLNIRAAYRFWDKKGEVAVSAFNALRDQHREFPRGETIGSRVMGWLTLRL